VSQDKGFSVWQMIDDERLMPHSTRCFIEEHTVSQVLEYDVNQVIASTMSCIYFMVNLKQGTVIREIKGQGKYSIDLIRVPYYEHLGAKNIYCGVENDAYVLVDFENEQTLCLQQDRGENQSPWYTGAFFLRTRPECMVVAEEKKRAIRSFVVNV